MTVEVKNYKRKPTVVQAIQFNGANIDDLYEFGQIFILDKGKDIQVINDGTEILIKYINRQGIPEELKTGDYLIKGIDGEVYSCNKNTFSLLYEKTNAPFEINERFIDPNEPKGEVSSNEEN